MNKPTGTVTFLFTDIEGSTKLAQEFPDTLPVAVKKHHSIMRKAIESNKGFVFEIVGDVFCAAFDNAIDAVKAAYDAQIKLNSEKCLPAVPAENEAAIKVRMGIHCGNARWDGKRYMGYITLARTNRVMSAAHGGQILISNVAYELAKEKVHSEISFLDLGARQLKDFIQPMRIYQITSSELPHNFPPIKTLNSRLDNLPVQLTSFIGREAEIPSCPSIINKKPRKETQCGV